MQRTASRSAIYLIRVCDPLFGCVESCSALAVGGLVSRLVPHHYSWCLDLGVRERGRSSGTVKQFSGWKTLIFRGASPSSPVRGAASDGPPHRACTSAAPR